MRYFLLALLLTGCSVTLIPFPDRPKKVDRNITMFALPGTEWLFADENGSFIQCSGVVEVTNYPPVHPGDPKAEFKCVGEWNAGYDCSCEVNNTVIYIGDGDVQ